MSAANSVSELDEEQKRRLRAVRRGYRAENVEIKDNGWKIEVTYMDGTKEIFDAKKMKIKKSELA